MNSNIIEIQSVIFSKYFTDEDINFLSNFHKKRDIINRELEDFQGKKEKVFYTISNNRKQLENNPRELNRYISSSEYVLESIETINKNLKQLLNEYGKVEQKFELISEKINKLFENYNFEEDVKSLLNEINFAKELEEAIKIDNNKNYLIIESFLNNTIEFKMDKNKINNTKDLTIDTLEDNMVLRIYEKRVELPYTKKEIGNFMVTYPDNYKTVQDVISKEFIIHMSLFNKHPVLSRFKEAYYLCRTKEMMSIFDSFNYAKSIMFKTNLNSYIIAAVKSKKQLEDYIYCLDNDKLNEYNHFKIVFNVNPLAV